MEPLAFIYCMTAYGMLCAIDAYGDPERRTEFVKMIVLFAMCVVYLCAKCEM